MTLVREDEKGLYVIAGGVTARPGAVNGYGHAYRMDDGGLKKGDKVTARHSGGTPLVKIKLPDETVTRWFGEGEHRDRSLTEADPEAKWDDKGLRVYPKPETEETITPRQIKAIRGADIMKELGL